MTGPTHQYCVTTVEKVTPTCVKKSVVLVCTYEGGVVTAGLGGGGLQQCGGQAGADSRFGYVHIQSRSMAPQHERHFLKSKTQT